MPRIIKPLSPKQVESAKPKEKTYTLFDGDGLFLEVQPTGSRLWRYKYTYRKKVRKISFGQYPLVTLAEARKKREENKKLIQAGKDPRAVKKEQQEQERARTEHTFEKIARDWHQNNLAGWKESTAKDTIGRLERDVFSQIGDIPINEITHQQVIAVLRRIEARGALEMARRTKASVARNLCQA